MAGRGATWVEAMHGEAAAAVRGSPCSPFRVAHQYPPANTANSPSHVQMRRASPEDARLMVELGLLHLKHGRAARAFTLFGSALTYDPSDAKVLSGMRATWRPP